jgi:hypothetical protein
MEPFLATEKRHGQGVSFVSVGAEYHQEEF